VLLITLGILAAVAVGIGTERWDRKRAQRLAALALNALLYVLLPVVALVNVGRLNVTSGVAAGIGIGYVTVISVSVLAWLIARRLGLPRPLMGAAIVGAMVANTGYLGIPLAGTLLGHGAIAAAVAFDLVVSQPMLFLGAFGVGATMGTQAGADLRSRLRTFFSRNVTLPAAILGLILPASTFSSGLVDASHVLVVLIAPIGFFALGVTMTGESESGELELPPKVTSPVAIALGLRIVVAPAIMVSLAALVPGVPDTYLLLAAMPTGLNALTAAHGYGLDAKVVAAAIAWSTAVVLVVAAVAGAVT
jgi:predicted permease